MRGGGGGSERDRERGLLVFFVSCPLDCRVRGATLGFFSQWLKKSPPIALPPLPFLPFLAARSDAKRSHLAARTEKGNGAPQGHGRGLT